MNEHSSYITGRNNLVRMLAKVFEEQNSSIISIHLLYFFKINATGLVFYQMQ